MGLLGDKNTSACKEEIRRALKIWTEPHKTCLAGTTKAQLLKPWAIKCDFLL